MKLPFRRRSPAFTGDFPATSESVTEAIRAIPPAPWHGTTVPLIALRGQPRYAPAGFHPAPGPPRRFTHQDETSRWQIDLNDAPGPVSVDERCQDALDCLRLKFKHLWREGMLFRVDEAEAVRLRGEELPPGERVITEYRLESAAHLLGPRQPRDPR